MTEQEAEALAARLARVWNVLAPFVVEVDPDGALFFAPLSQDVELQVAVLGGYFHFDLHEIGTNWGFLYCDDRVTSQPFTPKKGWDPTDDVDIRQRQSDWMPLFRRGCWLSGLPIEASAHEKMEWMQGFTKVEIQAWNLKM